MTEQMMQETAGKTIPAGYKQTEVGVIPEDWDVCELQEAVEFLDGQRRPIKSGDRAKIAGIYPYYGASGIVDYVNDYIFDEQLILLGEDGENILSRNVPLAFKVSGKIWVNNHAHVLKPKEDFHIGYLTELLESIDYSLLNSGTAQPKLNKQTCQKIKVIKPRHKEQTAIANVLSDSDALIDALEQLIAKKQAIKSATMQQLLTGRTRLPAFALRPDGTQKGYKLSELGDIPEDWEVNTLNNLVSFENGDRSSNYPSANEFVDYGIPFINAGHVSDGQINDSIMDYVPEYVYSRLGGGKVKTGDLLFCLRGSLGKFGVIDKDFGRGAIASSLVIVRPNLKRTSTDFVASYFKSGTCKKMIDLWAGGAAQPNLGARELGMFLVPIPQREEQTAIATILSDMDNELQALTQKLEKARALKQGMMQQLLTGKIRLPLAVGA
ncbi:restriction endonuclease subunit S [Aeromonas caviae]|uniref:restriction endonuclease subunit S n=1 Tax=Aeromonas caviae TaxID=648 RepID=UPI002B468333|nr:restriction endonuclease subunit S [Aeromonas caviae]